MSGNIGNFKLEYGKEYRLSISFKDKSELLTCIEYLHQQCSNLCKYLRISNCMFYSLGKRYTFLENKWYTYAFNAVEESAAITLCKIYDKQKDSYSVYNLLKYLCNVNNATKFFRNNESRIAECVDLFNNRVLSCYQTIKDMRDKRYMHISEAIFDKDYVNKYSATFAVYELGYQVALKIVNELYYMLEGRDLEPITKDEFNIQINKFITSLDENGD